MPGDGDRKEDDGSGKETDKLAAKRCSKGCKDGWWRQGGPARNRDGPGFCLWYLRTSLALPTWSHFYLPSLLGSRSSKLTTLPTISRVTLRPATVSPPGSHPYHTHQSSCSPSLPKQENCSQFPDCCMKTPQLPRKRNGIGRGNG